AYETEYGPGPTEPRWRVHELGRDGDQREWGDEPANRDPPDRQGLGVDRHYEEVDHELGPEHRSGHGDAADRRGDRQDRAHHRDHADCRGNGNRADDEHGASRSAPVRCGDGHRVILSFARRLSAWIRPSVLL